MAVQEFNIAEIKRKMQNSLNVLKGEFAGLRTGRASPGSWVCGRWRVRREAPSWVSLTRWHVSRGGGLTCRSCDD